MTDKPLEWEESTNGLVCIAKTGLGMYLVGRNSGHIIWYDDRSNTIVPGPYDGTIETAKQRCEEHRKQVEAGK